jgi:DNA adenine methylase
VQQAAFDFKADPDRSGRRPPHPIPYQGSKRLLAPEILGIVEGHHFPRLIEPFAGAAAISLAAASAGLADQFLIGDSLVPLIGIWSSILGDHGSLAAEYEDIWTQQLIDPAGHFALIRERFNRDRDPASLLYLLARCVKNSPRFNRDGQFNQSADHRRHGMRPDKMRREISGAAVLLSGRTVALAGDFKQLLVEATPEDLVYMDPPYAGTTYGTDRRYHRGLLREELIAALCDLSKRGVPYLLSYDGKCGTRTYADPLPERDIGARRLELVAGRSAQATLAGRVEITVESLYVSESLLPERVNHH